MYQLYAVPTGAPEPSGARPFLRGLRDASGVRALGRLFAADIMCGAAVLLWLATGLALAFCHVRNAPDFYLRNAFFWVKMTFFAAVFALEIWPLVSFIRWRR